MRIKKRKRNTYTEIYLVLENLEAISIPSSAIKKFTYKTKNKVIVKMDLIVNDKAKLQSFADYDETKASERVLAYDDICYIIKYYKNIKKYIRIKWKDNGNDYTNKHQSSFVDGKGLLNIKIEVSE